MSILPVELCHHVALFIDDPFTFHAWTLCRKDFSNYIQNYYAISPTQLHLFLYALFHPELSKRLWDVYNTALLSNNIIVFHPSLLYSLQCLHSNNKITDMFKLLNRCFYPVSVGSNTMTCVKGDQENIEYFLKF